MRRLHLGTLVLTLTSFAAAAVLVGCGGTKEDSPSPAATNEKATPGRGGRGGKGQKKALASGMGSLKGKVTFDGAKPDLVAMTKNLLTQIEKKAEDRQNCLTGATPLEQEEQEWRIGESGGLANVFVYLKPASGTEFALDADTPGVKAHKDHQVIVDQPHCAFMPHAVGIFASYSTVKDGKKATVPTGEKLVVKNTAKMPHNTKYSGQGQDGGNQTIQPATEMAVDSLKPSDKEVQIQCTIHPWMSAVARVFNHPYFAITDKDGNFEIKNVPAGEVNVVVWHEGAGYINPSGAKGDPVTLTDKETTKDFSAKYTK